MPLVGVGDHHGRAGNHGARTVSYSSARALGKASDARLAIGDGSKAAAFDRMKRKVMHGEATSQAKAEMASDSIEDRLAALEREEEIERMLAEIKARRAAEK